MSQSFINVQDDAYLRIIIILAPLLNFLSGVNIDIYSPSMPAMSQYFHVTDATIKNIIPATMLGFALGCLVFGAIIDIYGRREAILTALFILSLSNLGAIFSSSIEQLLIIRFIQGAMVAVMSIGSRALIVDNFTGKKYTIAILYSSVAYGLGPITGPALGGFLQYHFGWQANFLVLSVISIILFFLLTAILKNNFTQTRETSITHIVNAYVSVVKNKTLLIGVVIMSGVLIEQLIYPTIGPFIIKNVLNLSVLCYGGSALLIGLCYLLGVTANRFLIHSFELIGLIKLGFIILITGALFQICFALLLNINLFTLIFPILIMNFSLGFIFPNILALILKLMPQNIGKVSAVQSCLMMLIGSVALSLISKGSISYLIELAPIYLSIIITQLVCFILLIKRCAKLRSVKT